ncbi:molybdenum cofactor biosynthesis protein MoaE [Alteromonas sp. H39]|uniref:molybdenum cofactor biosynthesis protein MoaE n=1 Tax=Alteromonas sp. H39 TaxID=3389876 RepID=UPI0039DFFFEF
MFAEVVHSPLQPAEYYSKLKEALPAGKSGAIVTFTGLVRDFNEAGPIDGISLEHYPGMTENAMLAILTTATERFSLVSAGIVHRVGDVSNVEEIVWVGCASRHRNAAFDAAGFIMDMLKQSVPLWKKEIADGKAKWVAPKASDDDAALRWLSEADAPPSAMTGKK